MVSKGLLVRQSSFFESALNGTWKEAEDNIIHLPEDQPEIFQLYLAWRYQRVVPVQPATINKDTIVEQYRILIRAYVFADKIRDIDFSDAIIDACADVLMVDKWCVDYELINLAYTNTPVGSKLRQFLVDCIFYTTWNFSTDPEPTMHADLAYDLANRFMRSRFGILDLEKSVDAGTLEPMLLPQAWSNWTTLL